jgi:glycolate oxidase subunit GlcD
LIAQVGERHVRSRPALLATYARDALPTLARRPAFAIFPGSRDEVAGVLRILHHYGVAFVARGAGTGLSGGALADRDAALIVLTRLNRILEIDSSNHSALVEPGVVNATLSAAVAPLGLHYAPDPSSQTACTLGGNVAENAGGPHCFKYGVTTNHILELEVVLPNGTVTTLGSPSGASWGPDLVGLFVGSEGMFGIATAIRVRLLPLPGAVRTLLAGFPTLRTAGTAVSAIIEGGIVPAALEMMDQTCIRVVEASRYAAGYPTDAAAVLIVELDGPEADALDHQVPAVEAILRRAGATEVRVAADPAARERLWQGRKKAFGALGRLSPDLMVQDAVVPRTALPDVLDAISAIGERHGLTIGNVFHAGDGNLHPNICFDGADPAERGRAEEAMGEIMTLCVGAGGTITGEHGVGLDKLRYMTTIFSPTTLGAMRAVRRVFDVQERANPGKVLPIHSCREWGGRVEKVKSGRVEELVKG